MKIILLFSLLLSQSPQPRPIQQVWRPAIYRGLRIGKSKRAEMLKVFGQPKWSRAAETGSHEEVWNNYERAGEFPGVTVIVLERARNVISRIDFYPTKLTKQQAIAHFGPHYIVTRYNFEPCHEDEESEPIYESPDGLLQSVEYRARGIAISLGNEEMVTKISYVSGPIGAPKSRCQQ